MAYFGVTDVGKKRSMNQDSFCIKEYGEAILAVVCDGMGGAAGGAEASGTACSEFVGVMDDRLSDGTFAISATRRAVRDLMFEGVAAANERICAMSRESDELRGMGTTLVASLICGDMIYTVNVGDSRMYLVSEDKAEQITHDHSFVQYLVDNGKLTPDEARRSINRNIITRAVGTEESVEADFFATKLPSDDSGDYYTGDDGGNEAEGSKRHTEDIYAVLCSDGLTNHVTPVEMQEMFASGDKTPEELAKTLVEMANAGGGSDNITAVVLKVR